MVPGSGDTLERQLNTRDVLRAGRNAVYFLPPRNADVDLREEVLPLMHRNNSVPGKEEEESISRDTGEPGKRDMWERKLNVTVPLPRTPACSQKAGD